VGCLVVLTAGPLGAARLERVEASSTPTGADVRLVLTAPLRARVTEVAGAPGAALRVYVDLPVGTAIGARVARVAEAPAPVASLRVGATEDGRPRVVVDLATPADYRVERTEGGRVVVLHLSGEAASPTPTPSEPPPPPVAALERPPPPSAPEVGARPKIVLDPGHGGRDPGAHGFALEKDVTLAIARRLASLLRTRLGAQVVLTRNEDRTLPLSARTARANGEQADLFVSIHTNASPRGRLHGIETYTLDNTSDHATIRLARMENGPSGRAATAGKADLRYILSDLVQVGKMDESIALASAVQRGVVRRLRTEYHDVEDLGVKRGPFYVLVGAFMPCVLVETSFLTHPVEGRRLTRPAYREAVAEGLYEGIARFVADTRRAHTL
jgi:N-acetylmuramoyl-L-alanine amidase